MRINSTGVSGENDVTGFRPPAPGRYHVVIKHVDESFQKADAVIVEFEILAGTVPGQEGMTHTERLWMKDGNSTDQHLRFALVAGIIQPGTEAEVSFQHAVGRQMVIGLDKRKSKKDDKEYTNIADYGMAIWGLNNPEVSDVPRMPGPMQQQAPQQQMQQPPVQQQMPMPQQQQYQQPAPQQQYAQPQQQQVSPQQQPAGDGGWGDI